MILPIPPLSQRDSRWSSQRLGTVNSTTIGSHGCVITSMCMISTYYGHPITPNMLDDILTERGLYYDGNLYINNSITKIYPDIKFDKVTFCETTPAPISEIKSYIDQGKPVVVALMNQGVRHYILVVGYEGDKMYANDPWQGDKVAINDRWGDPASKILQVNFFSGLVLTQPVTTPTPPSVSDQTTINLGVELGFMEVGAIRSEILDLRQSKKAMEEDLTNAQKRIAEQTKIDLGSEIGVMEVEAIRSEILDLRRDKRGLEQQLTVANISKITPVAENQKPTGVIELNPVNTDTNNKWVPYTSRKFLLSILASGIAFLNNTFNLGLNEQQMLTTIAPMIAYIGVEGLADVVERSKKLPISTYVNLPKPPVPTI